MEKTYIIRNLDCAHCGGLIEKALGEIEGVQSAVLIFPSRKIRVKSASEDCKLLEKMNEIADSIEPGVEIVPEAEGEKEEESPKSQIMKLAVGAVVFASAIAVQSLFEAKSASLVLFIAAYLILGSGILSATAKNISGGKIFDENFLMTVATVGAFLLGENIEAVGVVLFYGIGETFEKIAVSRSRKAITAAAGLRVDKAEVMREGEFVQVSSEVIAVGDIVRIKAGERAAVDGVIVKGSADFDTSAITGEAVPVSAEVGDSIVSGYISLNEAVEIRATAAAGESMIAKIAEAVENASASKPKIDKFISRFAAVYTPIVIVIAVLTAVIPSLITGDWGKWVYTALTFLVISCPCALVLSVPLAYFSGIGAASKYGILFKGGAALEALGKVKAVAFDKTGTLTEGKFTVSEITPFGSTSRKELLEICCSCESASDHPVAQSIVKYCREKGIEPLATERNTEYAGKGISCILKDGRKVLCGNSRLMADNRVAVSDGNDTAGSVVYVAAEGVLLGRITVSDSLKSTSVKTIADLKNMGIGTVVLSGDKAENVRAAAERLGADYGAGELLPTDKLEQIGKLREKYGAVMFVGDGINDGPVLAGADVGGAMNTGSDLALDAADVVFMNTETEAVLKAKHIADRTLKVSRQNIIAALVIKAAVLIFGLLGHPSMWFAVLADSGTAMLLVLNSVKILNTKKQR